MKKHPGGDREKIPGQSGQQFLLHANYYPPRTPPLAKAIGDLQEPKGSFRNLYSTDRKEPRQRKQAIAKESEREQASESESERGKASASECERK